MNSNYQDNANIPEVQAMMGRKPDEKNKIMEFLVQLLRNPVDSAMTGVPPKGEEELMRQLLQGMDQPPPNAMGQGGGFNPNNRPGMQGL